MVASGDASVAVASDTATPTRLLPRSSASTRAATSETESDPDLSEGVVDAVRQLPSGGGDVGLAPRAASDGPSGLGDELAGRSARVLGDGRDERDPFTRRRATE